MPATNGFLKRGRLRPERAQPAQTRSKSHPFIGDERQKKSGATVPAKSRRGLLQIGHREIVLLKIHAAVTIDLNIEERRREPQIIRRLPGNSFKLCNDALAPPGTHQLACGKMARHDLSFL